MMCIYTNMCMKKERFRIDQEPSLLDLIFTNEESIVDNLEINAA